MSLLQSVRRLIRSKQVRLREEDVVRAVEKHGAESWFTYAFRERRSRWDLWETCFWIDDHLPHDASILETGCGCALNLIWLAQRGYSRLAGFDVEPAAIAAGRELVERAGVAVQLWCDDGLDPRQLPPEPLDLVLALNWTFLTDRFDLAEFLDRYGRALAPGGVVVVDVIDESYARVANHQVHSSDWTNPTDQRRPSEYRVRYSRNQVEEAARSSGMEIRHVISRPQLIPKHVYIFGCSP